MAALFMRQFNPSVPTMEATSSEAECMLGSLTTSENGERAILLFKKRQIHLKKKLMVSRIIWENRVRLIPRSTNLHINIL